ncbi:11239_t:CDS:2, partial [Scutellospora calospora]
ITAIMFPLITSLVWLFDEIPPVWIITIATLLLDVKFLFFFRAIEGFGNYFAILIGVAKKVVAFLVVLGLIVFAFAHSLHILLRPTSEYSYDQPNYTDDVNNPWNLVSTYQSVSSNGSIESTSLIETPDANTNLFAVFSTAIIAVYFMLTGDTSSVTPWVWKDNWTLVFLLMIFSFFTTIYLMNLFIGLLNMAIEITNNDESFLALRGE